MLEMVEAAPAPSLGMAWSLDGSGSSWPLVRVADNRPIQRTLGRGVEVPKRPARGGGA